MTTESLIISFANESSDSSDSGDPCPTVLKQEEWTSGRVTKSDIIKALEEQLFDGLPFSIDCGISETGYESALNLYPSTSQIGEVGVTHGNISQGSILETVTQTETVNFNLSTEETTKYPIDRVVSYEWQGSVWDVEGNTITPAPSIEVSGDTVTISETVYGDVLIVYETKRYSNSLDIPARDGVFGSAYGSVAWVIKDCGVEMLVLDPPDNAETNLENNVDCTGSVLPGFGGGLSVIDDPGTVKYPEAEPVDITYYIDYCTQTLDPQSYYG